MTNLFTSWMFLHFAPTRRHAMDEIVFFGSCSERHALQILQPGFPHDIPVPDVPQQPLPDSPADVPVPDPKDIPPYDPKDVPPPKPGRMPTPNSAPPKSVDRLGEFHSGTDRY
jgi:hypothetical protein